MKKKNEINKKEYKKVTVKTQENTFRILKNLIQFTLKAEARPVLIR